MNIISTYFIVSVVLLCRNPIKASKYRKYNISSVCPQIAQTNGQADERTAQIEWNLTADEGESAQKTLFVDKSFAALIEDSWNTSSHHVPFDCVFEIKTEADDLGLFLVVNRLTFPRKDEDSACRDFLKVGDSETICGIAGYNDHSIRSFDSSSGAVRVHLHVDSHPIDESVINFQISIVLTSYSRFCKQGQDFSCHNNNERCIPREYYRDKIINCVVPSCLDELNCFNQNFEELTVNVQNIIVIGLISFFITGSLVGILLWFCWKKSFKQSQMADPHFELQTATNIVQSLEQISRSDGAVTDPQSSTTSDLPPSYDILFPDK